MKHFLKLIIASAILSISTAYAAPMTVTTMQVPAGSDSLPLTLINASLNDLTITGLDITTLKPGDHTPYALKLDNAVTVTFVGKSVGAGGDFGCFYKFSKPQDMGFTNKVVTISYSPLYAYSKCEIDSTGTLTVSQ